MATVTSFKADIWSISPASEWIKELWVVCVFICRKRSHTISGNMVTRKKRINQMDEKCLLINFCSKVLWLSELLKYMERRILLDQNIGRIEQILNSAIVMEEGKCLKNILEGGGGPQDLLRYDIIDISLAKTWCLNSNRFEWTTWPAIAGNYFEFCTWFWAHGKGAI